MTNEQIIQVSNKYQAKLDALGYSELREDRDNPGSLTHISWMLYQITQLVNNNQIEKANRWLGFVQGALWALDVCTIDEMREDNK